MSSSVSLIPLADTKECAERLLEAAETLGFVYITLEGSDIPPEKVERMFDIVCPLALLRGRCHFLKLD